MLSFFKQKLHNLLSDRKFAEILRGSAWAFAAQIIASGLGLLVSVVIARYYGAEGMGIVAVVTSVLSLVAIFTVLGNDTAILRHIPEHLIKHSAGSAFRIYRQSLFMVLGFSLLAGILLYFSAGVLATRVFSKPHLFFFLALSALFIPFNGLRMLTTQAVRGMRLIRIFSLMLILPFLANLLLLLGLTAFRFSIGNPVYAMLGAQLVTGVAGWIIMEKSFRHRLTPEDRIVAIPPRTMLGISVPMSLTSGLFFMTSQIGVIILGMFRVDAEVGIYAVAVRLSTLVGIILISINSMAAPRFAELFHAGKIDELFYVARKSAKLIFWVTTPILLFLIIAGRPLLQYAFGGEFVLAYPALLLLILGQFVNALSGSTGFFMNMTGHENMLRNFTAITTALNIILSLLLIPRYGILGAAFAAMTGISLLNILILIYIWKKYQNTTGYFPFLNN